MAHKKAKQQFTPREQLELFVARCEELSKTRLVASGAMAKFGFTIKGEAVSEGFKITEEIREPDAEDLRSFLLTFRQFILNDEPIFIFKVLNLCYQHLKDPKMQEEFAKARTVWQDETKGFVGIGLEVDGRKLTPEYVLDLWINGGYFHNDAELVKELKRLEGTDIRLDRAGFLMVLPRLTQIIFNIGMVINYGLKNGSFDVK